MASRSNPTAPAQVVNGNNMMIKSDKQEKHDGPAAAATTETTKQSPHRRKRPSNNKHKTKKQRRSSSRAERLEQERLLQESIRKHTTLLTASRNPELFVLSNGGSFVMRMIGLLRDRILYQSKRQRVRGKKCVRKVEDQ